MSDDWRLPNKPYDLRERLFQFACVIVRVVEFLHTRGPVPKALSYQLLQCGTSVGSNYEEADDGSSDRDKLAKRKTALREAKETRYRLRVLRKCGYLTCDQDPVIKESDELVRIIATLVNRIPTVGDIRAHVRFQGARCDSTVLLGSWKLGVGSSYFKQPLK